MRDVTKQDGERAVLNDLVECLKHDLRNPISNILGYADLVRQEAEAPLNDEQEAFLSRIEDNCRSALTLLERLAGEADRLRRKDSR